MAHFAAADQGFQTRLPDESNSGKIPEVIFVSFTFFVMQEMKETPDTHANRKLEGSGLAIFFSLMLTKPAKMCSKRPGQCRVIPRNGARLLPAIMRIQELLQKGYKTPFFMYTSN